MDSIKRIKVINSHSGLCRWLAETGENPIAYLAHSQVSHIPSPYRYSPTQQVLDWDGRAVVYFETRHKRYEIFEVPPQMQRFDSDAAAEKFYIQSLSIKAL